MRFVIIPLPPNLPARWIKVYPARVAVVNALVTQEERSKYLKKNGSWGLLKKWLSNASGHKCWYCEAKSNRAVFDVDHFRPKLGITVDGVKLVGHNGYFWLAYEWSNFRLSCQRCNRPEKDELTTLHGKANEFPLQNETSRCNAPASPITAEIPRLLDPCVEADCALLAHTIDGEIKLAAPVGTWEYQRAYYTIERLGFNEWNIPESKKNDWRLLDDLIRLVGNQPVIITHLQEHLSLDHEYSSFFRSAIGSHRDKAWVEELL
ncbi:hypothetical protein [Methylobacter sp. S3L5C]|uniref:hypothetical protein n=1 Tax=Methylobacter sp. S3L5C TaxID=2839024 RepID=UPI001FAD0614|nr:hypothetical protein [Methylobacter sp. S3L5C]UOA07727.1 hypothetical protein KKZ03_15915 [Methylobacter sp. S3L5C]